MIIRKVPCLNTYMPDTVKNAKPIISHAGHAVSHGVDINSSCNLFEKTEAQKS